MDPMHCPGCKAASGFGPCDLHAPRYDEEEHGAMKARVAELEQQVRNLRGHLGPDQEWFALEQALASERSRREEAEKVLKSYMDYFMCDEVPVCTDEDEPAPRSRWCNNCELYARARAALAAGAPREGECARDSPSCT